MADEKKGILKKAAAFFSGLVIGTLGGLIGLGGAEFRLPVLISGFRFPALEAIILNKTMSLIVVASSILFRSAAIPFGEIAGYWMVILNLLAGSLVGAWLGASLATKLKTKALYRTLAILLVVIAVVLLIGHFASTGNAVLIDEGALRVAIGVLAGVIIGMFASIMGVAGGELLIPTLILLFAVDIKLAGSLSLVISLPTMLTGFARYSKDNSFKVIGRNKIFVLVMAGGSIVGAAIGGMLLGVVSDYVLLPVLACILLISSYKVWTHK